MKNQMPLCADRASRLALDEREGGVVPMSPALQQTFFEQYAYLEFGGAGRPSFVFWSLRIPSFAWCLGRYCSEVAPK
jgi:hypothetical protein